MRFITPIILILIAVSVFFVFANPLYGEISALRERAVAFNDALGNSKMLENERDKLTAKYNAIDPENVKKLEKMLPENVDNIRLILEIEQIAAPYGMTLKDVKYNTDEEEASSQSGAIVPGGARDSNKDYGTFDLEFSTTGRYGDFINFSRDLESNLRLVDIVSLSFASNMPAVSSSKPVPADTYKYDFKIRTYWLKN